MIRAGRAATVVATILLGTVAASAPPPALAQSYGRDGGSADPAYDGRRGRDPDDRRGLRDRRDDDGPRRGDSGRRGDAADPDYDAGYDEPRAGRTRRPITPAAAPPDVSPMSDVPLYVGTQANCNAGEVTTSPNHKNCATQPIGRTVSAQRAGPGAAPLYVGVTAGRNAGIVALQANRAGGTGRVIGYMVPAAQGATRLFAGAGACNAGLVTTSPNHLGCATREIGSTAR